MRYDKSKLILIGVIALLLVVLVVLTIVALVGLGGNEPDSNPGGTTGPTQSNQQDQDHILKTPYGEIVFPEKLAKHLKVDRTETPELQLDFIAELDSGKEQKLFSLRFGAPEAPAVGQLVSGDGVVVGVYVTIYKFSPDDSWKTDEVALVTEMQEALNDVMQSLDPAPLGTQNPGTQEDVVIETPYGNLYFPGQWTEELKTTVDESDGYEVVFQGVINGHDAIPLFAVNFGGSKGTEVHTVCTENNVPVFVRLRTFELEMDDWSAVDQATARAMQEDLNHMLAKLRGE